MGRIDNMIKRLTDVFNREDTSNNYKFLSIDGQQYDDLNDMLIDVSNSHYVSTADGVSLDSIALIVGLVRRTGETDVQFRARILARVTGFIGGGTKSSIANSVAQFIDTDVFAISVIDSYLDAGAYGHFSVYIDTTYPWIVVQGINDLTLLINQIKAAGTVFDFLSILMDDIMTMSDYLSFDSNTIIIVDSISMGDDDRIWRHITNITKTESLNTIL